MEGDLRVARDKVVEVFQSRLGESYDIIGLSVELKTMVTR